MAIAIYDNLGINWLWTLIIYFVLAVVILGLFWGLPWTWRQSVTKEEYQHPIYKRLKKMGLVD